MSRDQCFRVPSASVSPSELCRLPAGAQRPKAWHLAMSPPPPRGDPSSCPHTPALGNENTFLSGA